MNDGRHSCFGQRRNRDESLPDADTWLVLDEQERIILVELYHRKQRIHLPNGVHHATIHVIVENQLAMRETVVVEVCATRRRAPRTGGAKR